MKKHLSKRRVLLGLVVVALAIGSSVAYAFWTSSGTGAGSADVGTSSNFTVEQIAPLPTDLVPGGAAQDVNIRVTNTATAEQQLNSVTIAVDAPGTCDDAWFTATDPAAGLPVVLDAAGGPADSVDLVGTIEMTESGTNQDACKNAAIDLDIDAA